MTAPRSRVVAIGGGHGLSQVLTALKTAEVSPTAVVTVADDGGSSGRLRRDLGIVAPGDLRMALLALARDPQLADLLGHRFARGELEGHAVGNLVLVALAERAGGDFVAALDAAGRLLRCAGRVLPSTLQPVSLRACVDGEEVDGQVRVGSTAGPIERVWLDPASPPACAEAVAAIRAADVLLLGPGSLYTSVIANLLVPGVAEAVEAATAGGAKLVHVANLRTQPGETAELDLASHVDALCRHLPGIALHAVVVHDGPVPEASGSRLGPRLEHPAVRRVVRADLAARVDGLVTWAHDPRRLAAALAPLLPAPAG